MKPSVYERVISKVDIESEFSETIIPAGSQGVIVECYANPEGYAIDFEIPDNTLVGGFRYENVILVADQFNVITE